MKRLIYILLSAILLANVTGCSTNAIKRKSSEDQTEVSEKGSEVSEEATTEVVSENNDTDASSSSSAEYKDILKGMVDEKVTVISDAADKTISSVGDSYDSYMNNKDSLDGWYDLTLKESKDLYEKIKANNIEQYKEISSNLSADSSYDWDRQMDKTYKAWDDAMGDYYREWDDIYGDVYDSWDDAIGNNDGIDYSESSSTWSDAYSLHSDAWSAQYDAHSDAWSELYNLQSDVWSALFSGDIAIDSVIEKSETDHASEKIDNNEVSANESTEETSSEPASESAEDAGSESADQATDNDLVRDEIKEAIDSYESFVDEYCEFMKNYDSSDISSLTKYTDLISKEIDMSKEFKDIENMELTTAEALYYSEVSLRCSKKMMEAASKIH